MVLNMFNETSVDKINSIGFQTKDGVILNSSFIAKYKLSVF